jgi:hypothetical protein
VDEMSQEIFYDNSTYPPADLTQPMGNSGDSGSTTTLGNPFGNNAQGEPQSYPEFMSQLPSLEEWLGKDTGDNTSSFLDDMIANAKAALTSVGIGVASVAKSVAPTIVLGSALTLGVIALVAVAVIIYEVKK